MKEIYAWQTTKECDLYLDHTPSWCGDTFACSNCALIFLPAKPEAEFEINNPPLTNSQE